MSSYFYLAFEGMKRLGPGSDDSTRRAMEWYQPGEEEIRILDMGCGRGTQTLLLAERYPKATSCCCEYNA